jgi:hypothetical protein
MLKATEAEPKAVANDDIFGFMGNAAVSEAPSDDFMGSTKTKAVSPLDILGCASPQ